MTSRSVTVTCPTCLRDVTIGLSTAAPQPDDDPRCIGRLVIDQQAIRAHLLTHTTHDGEPLPLAA